MSRSAWSATPVPQPQSSTFKPVRPAAGNAVSMHVRMNAASFAGGEPASYTPARASCPKMRRWTASLRKHYDSSPVPCHAGRSPRCASDLYSVKLPSALRWQIAAGTALKARCAVGRYRPLLRASGERPRSRAASGGRTPATPRIRGAPPRKWIAFPAVSGTLRVACGGAGDGSRDGPAGMRNGIRTEYGGTRTEGEADQWARTGERTAA